MGSLTDLWHKLQASNRDKQAEEAKADNAGESRVVRGRDVKVASLIDLRDKSRPPAGTSRGGQGGQCRFEGFSYVANIAKKISATSENRRKSSNEEFGQKCSKKE
jgi:hypothetical protein